jgi:hypothetical protein
MLWMCLVPKRSLVGVYDRSTPSSSQCRVGMPRTRGSQGSPCSPLDWKGRSGECFVECLFVLGGQ